MRTRRVHTSGMRDLAGFCSRKRDSHCSPSSVFSWPSATRFTTKVLSTLDFLLDVAGILNSQGITPCVLWGVFGICRQSQLFPVSFTKRKGGTQLESRHCDTSTGATLLLPFQSFLLHLRMVNGNISCS
ncbi:hypothetical protein TNIN_102151 [Trichonephila inaurata madagascariensis]|uniref:Uncharacterized protein n=1 Tax=Trichonephila inaurata madagascariensis TaxID=2747483 RepID=A0A8X7C125_9ARAC|nr:hypothetical protein TNIN_102151 [Trichonephila inaurata madagascariensis]